MWARPRQVPARYAARAPRTLHGTGLAAVQTFAFAFALANQKCDSGRRWRKSSVLSYGLGRSACDIPRLQVPLVARRRNKTFPLPAFSFASNRSGGSTSSSCRTCSFIDPPRCKRSDPIVCLGHHGELLRGLASKLPRSQPPPPVGTGRTGPIHTRVAAEAEEILHWNDCRVRN